jgi:hypothetical protein
MVLDPKIQLQQLKLFAREAFLSPTPAIMSRFFGLATPQAVMALILAVESFEEDVSGPDGWKATALHLVSNCDRAQTVFEPGKNEGPVDLKASLMLTFMRLQNDLNAFEKAADTTTA